MSNAIIVFGSSMGNTKRLTEGVAEGLREGGMEVTIKDVVNTRVEELNEYDLIVLGCSTWGAGDLQDDFVDFYEKMAGLPSLEEKKAAVFGPGDSDIYPDTFCDAVDMIEDRLKELGANLVVESFKVDGDVEAVMADAKDWGLKMVDG
ncbi:MAG: flavodoxin [Candidatus Auribacterota bacterium]|nr:flavodoxin [Candidatus Auribacterota bacterium]